jgi:hypothetical protein
MVRQSTILLPPFPDWHHLRARMAQPLTEFKLVEVGRPKLGELKPSSVRADVKIHLNVRYETVVDFS